MIIPEPKKYIKKEGFLKLESENAVASANLVCVIDKTLAEEGYRLKIEEKGITLAYSTLKGRFYGETTLKQLAMLYGGEIPYAEIEDEPRFKYRGYMLDVGRYFFSVDDICKQIDYLALYKINYLHLHLTEDQGWRVEIKKYPKLTEIGSSRNRTACHFKEHKGFYTQEELKTVVAYAAARCITVVPEIDLPGHFTAAIAAYPELGCFGREVKVANTFGVKYEVACLGKEGTMRFIKDVIDELAEIFPGEFFHIGGDEVPHARWEQCPDCQAKLKKLGLKNWNEYQAAFTNEISTYLYTKGKSTITWNEAKPTGMVDKDVIWQYWSSADEPAIAEEINAGRVIINSCSRPYYLDLPYSLNSLASVHSYEPVFGGIKPEYAHRVFGVEFPLWTELVPTQKQAEIMTFPRLLAGAERGWSGQTDFKYFMVKYSEHVELLHSIGVKTPDIKKYNPRGMRWIYDRIWWERRQLYWGALQNISAGLRLKRFLKKQKANRGENP